MKKVIRRVRDEDCAAIARLHRQTIRNVNAKDYAEDIIKTWSDRSTAERFRNNAKRCKRWVAVIDGKVVGFSDHGLDGEFWGLYVHKDYIGQGIGSQLLKTVERSLQSYGARNITLKATVTAKTFYEKHGYRVVHRAFHQICDKRMPIYIMMKKCAKRWVSRAPALERNH